MDWAWQRCRFGFLKAATHEGGVAAEFYPPQSLPGSTMMAPVRGDTELFTLHPVTSERGSSDLPSPTDYGFPDYEDAVEPLTLDQVHQLLASPFAPIDAVFFERTGSLRDTIHAQGVAVMSVCYHTSDTPGWHYRGDVRDIVCLKIWRRGFFVGPDCYLTLRGDIKCLPRKCKDGRAYWGCAPVFWCIFHPNVVGSLVEQPDTIPYDFITFTEADRVILTRTSSSALGDESDKTFVFATRNLSPIRPCRARQTRLTRRPHAWEYESAEQRDHIRSSWAPYPNTCELLSNLSLLDDDPPLSSTYQSIIERFAVKWSETHPLPYDYDNADAQPTLEDDRAYSKERGMGNGQTISGVIPISLRKAQIIDHVADVEHCINLKGELQIVQLNDIMHNTSSEATDEWSVVLFLVLWDGENQLPQVLLPQDGCEDMVIQLSLPRGLSVQQARYQAIAKTDQLMRRHLQLRSFPILVAEHVKARVQIVAIPSTHQLQDQRLNAAEIKINRHIFGWFMLSALSHVMLKSFADLAVAKCMTFIQPSPYSNLHGLDGVNVGARGIHVMASGLDLLGNIKKKSYTLVEAEVYCLTVDRKLREALMVHDSDPDADYLHSWVERIGACDPSQILDQVGHQEVRVTELGRPDVADIKFTPRIPAPQTEPASYSDRQPDYCYEVKPSSLGDILTDTCVKDLLNYINTTLREDLVNIAYTPLERVRPRPFVRGSSCFKSSARGCIWDLRQIKKGIITPLELTLPLPSQLHQPTDLGRRGIDYIEAAYHLRQPL